MSELEEEQWLNQYIKRGDELQKQAEVGLSGFRKISAGILIGAFLSVLFLDVSDYNASRLITTVGLALFIMYKIMSRSESKKIQAKLDSEFPRPENLGQVN